MSGEHTKGQCDRTEDRRPELFPDSPSGQFAAVLAEHEKGEPVNTQDLINALNWRLQNQRREIHRLSMKVHQMRDDIQELTCGDPRKVCPNCREKVTT